MSINTNQSSNSDIDELFNRVNPHLREQMKLHSSQKSKNENKPSNSIALTEAKDLGCEFALEELSGKVSHICNNVPITIDLTHSDDEVEELSCKELYLDNTKAICTETN